jgi:transposase InsO family protein
VENVHRTVQWEFWGGICPGALEEWVRRFQGCVRFYNRRRQHSALGYTTPMQYALQRLACVSHMS